METQTAAPSLKTKSDFDSKKEFQLSINKRDFLIQISKPSDTEKLYINVKELSSISNIYYEEYFTLEQLKKLNKSFRYFDNIEEVVLNIYQIFEQKNASIKIEDNYLCIIINVNKGLVGNENISLKLVPKSLSLENICKSLCQEINELKANYIEIKKEIEIIKEQNNKNEDIKYKEIFDKMNKEIEMLKLEIKNLKDEKNKSEQIMLEIQKWKKDVEEKEKEENNLKNKIDSKIITKKEELNLISDRIQNNENLKNKKIFYKLIFRGTRDGELSSHFHQRCDGISPTITLVQSEIGHKFGGYAERPWKNSGGWVNNDDNSFLFSLDYMKIYNAVKGKDKYYFSDLGPWFEGIKIPSNMFKDKSYVNNKEGGNEYYSGFSSDFELNGGEQYFIPQEIEIFQIILQ